jgi:hypothetical protein
MINKIRNKHKKIMTILKIYSNDIIKNDLLLYCK